MHPWMMSLVVSVSSTGRATPLVRPIRQVFRRITHDAYHGVACRIRLVFAVPVVSAVVQQDAAAVCIDVCPLIVRPNLARADGLVLFSRRAGNA